MRNVRALSLFAPFLLAGTMLAGTMLAGCLGSPADVGAGASDLHAMDPSTEPLDDLGADEWEAAPHGCEGRLSSTAPITFRLASAREGLVAAVDVDGDIVCVDTLESVQDELEDLGEDERAEELGDRYLLAVSLPGITDGEGLRAGDPTPQPNLQAVAPSDATGGADRGDPTPQPNTNPR